MDTKEKTKTLDEILRECGISPSSQESNKLILWNDDVNSFDWVIYCLVDILKFAPEKAALTAFTVHHMGKDIIKSGSKDELEPYKQLLEERGLTLTIE